MAKRRRQGRGGGSDAGRRAIGCGQIDPPLQGGRCWSLRRSESRRGSRRARRLVPAGEIGPWPANARRFRRPGRTSSRRKQARSAGRPGGRPSYTLQRPRPPGVDSTYNAAACLLLEPACLVPLPALPSACPPLSACCTLPPGRCRFTSSPTGSGCVGAAPGTASYT